MAAPITKNCISGSVKSRVNLLLKALPSVKTHRKIQICRTADFNKKGALVRPLLENYTIIFNLGVRTVRIPERGYTHLLF
jgi:hypothetical protein